MNASVDHLFDMKAACCHCLSELSLNYTNGQKIIEANGIYTIAQLLFPEREEFRRRSSFFRLQVAFVFFLGDESIDVYMFNDEFSVSSEILSERYDIYFR